MTTPLDRFWKSKANVSNINPIEALTLCHAAVKVWIATIVAATIEIPLSGLQPPSDPPRAVVI